MAAPPTPPGPPGPPGPPPSSSDPGRPRRIVGTDAFAGPAPFAVPPPPPPGIVRGGRASTPAPVPAAVPAAAPAPAPARASAAKKNASAPAAINRPGQSPAAGVPSGALAGTIRGTVTVDLVRRRFRGPKALGAALLLTIVAAPLLASQLSGHGSTRWLAATEGYALAVLILVLLLGLSHGTVLGDMSYSARAFLPRRRKRATLPQPGAAPAQRQKPGRPVEYSTQVSRFKVEAFTGTTHPCVLPGEPTGGQLTDGAYVHVIGRRRPRSTELTARQVVLLSNANGAPIGWISAKKRTEFALARRMNRITYWLIAPPVAGFGYAYLFLR